MSYLLDTNVLSELRTGPRCDARVAAWFSAVADEDLWLSVLVVGEIRRGMRSSRPRGRACTCAWQSDWGR